MVEEHNFTLTELGNMLPWEREIYVSLLENKIKEETKNMQR
jgi:hypothetical protein